MPIFAANWKMNKFINEGTDFVVRFQGLLAEIPVPLGDQYNVIIAPPATHLLALSKSIEKLPIELGAQNCDTAKFGAYTGETSPAVIKEVGGEWVILGHSERRHLFGEGDALILSRFKAALEERLKVILCVGETLQERKAGKTFRVVETQLSILRQQELPAKAWERLVIAYEPVWAIGTGENATPQQAEEVHAFIRAWFLEKWSAEFASQLRILYGGSVKPDNAIGLMAQTDVDGFLIGTSSLDPVVFAGVIKNGLKSRP